MAIDPARLPHCIALYEALVDDAFYITLENSVSQGGREAMLHYPDYSMQEAEKYGLLYQPTKHQHGVSIWSKPQSPEIEDEIKAGKKAFLLQHMGVEAETCYQQIVREMSANAEDLLDENAWYLSIVGILPAYQNQGLGAGLILPVLKQSDRLGVPTFLETFTPRNMPFYERLGYQTVKSFFEPTTGSEYWLMARNCHTQKETSE